MKFCVNCGSQLSDETRFCSTCGQEVTAEAPVENDVTIDDSLLIQQEKECLNKFYRFFKYERLAWKIAGIVSLVFSLVFIGFGFLAFLMGAATGEEMGIAFAAGFGGIYVLYGLIFLPIAIINLKMVGKAEYYMNVIYRDARPVVVRCNSIGMLVFSYFFNTIAMAFIIVNFVFNKTNKEILARAIARQQGANK